MSAPNAKRHALSLVVAGNEKARLAAHVLRRGGLIDEFDHSAEANRQSFADAVAGRKRKQPPRRLSSRAWAEIARLERQAAERHSKAADFALAAARTTAAEAVS